MAGATTNVPAQGQPPSCSAAAALLDEPLVATAPVASAWVVLEQAGPWGRQALQSSHLDAELGEALAKASDGTGTTILLARRPGRHADDHSPDHTTDRDAAVAADPGTDRAVSRAGGGTDREGPGVGRSTAGARRVWVAHTAPGGMRMREAMITDPAELLGWDFAAIARGELPPVGRRTTEPVMFVCTNARRDVCCALAGLPLARDLAADPLLAERIWEASHIGGHRFAPTVLVLPHGTVHGRLDSASARALLSAVDSGELPLEHYRGRSSFRRPLQAAEFAVRRAHPRTRIDDLDVLLVRPTGVVSSAPAGPAPGPTPPLCRTEVRHRDGRAWRVDVVRTVAAPPRPESCGKADVMPEVFVAATPRRIPDWC
ncbi:MAG: sucrase ferredoxin [Actinomycetota bacterium]|nr:MAG: sucrase ferredoxin [Actinomycetota bacterium]